MTLVAIRLDDCVGSLLAFVATSARACSSPPAPTDGGTDAMAPRYQGQPTQSGARARLVCVRVTVSEVSATRRLS